MPTYKVHYFPARGYGEVPRQLLHLGGAQWEDVRIPREEWPDKKSKSPFGQMPYLTEDGRALAQSGSVTRYLARKFGYAGKDEWEQAQIDALYEQIRDHFKDMQPYFRAAMDPANGDKDKLYKEVAVPARDKLFANLDNYLAKSKSGFLVGDKLSYVDLLIADMLDTFQGFAPDFVTGHTKILDHKKKVQSQPKLAEWLKKRPQTPY